MRNEVLWHVFDQFFAQRLEVHAQIRSSVLEQTDGITNFHEMLTAKANRLNRIVAFVNKVLLFVLSETLNKIDESLQITHLPLAKISENQNIENHFCAVSLVEHLLDHFKYSEFLELLTRENGLSKSIL